MYSYTVYTCIYSGVATSCLWRGSMIVPRTKYIPLTIVKEVPSLSWTRGRKYFAIRKWGATLSPKMAYGNNNKLKIALHTDNEYIIITDSLLSPILPLTAGGVEF